MRAINASRVEYSVKLTNERGSALIPPKSMMVTCSVQGSMRKLGSLMSPGAITNGSFEISTTSGGGLFRRGFANRKPSHQNIPHFYPPPAHTPPATDKC